MEGRAQLKKKFEAANIGYESYRALIDSTINKKDDGIDIDYYNLVDLLEARDVEHRNRAAYLGGDPQALAVVVEQR